MTSGDLLQPPGNEPTLAKVNPAAWTCLGLRGSLGPTCACLLALKAQNQAHACGLQAHKFQTEPPRFELQMDSAGYAKRKQSLHVPTHMSIAKSPDKHTTTRLQTTMGPCAKQKLSKKSNK